VVALLLGLVLSQPPKREGPPTVERPPVADVELTGPAAERVRGCFDILRPGTRRIHPGCERIRERRGGVETRLGTVEIRNR
jgi:hypothetical protein